MIKDNDPNAVWLDPRFENNPAYLADEAEALLAAAKEDGSKKVPASVYISPVCSHFACIERYPSLCQT
jgi:hypothetical protein